MPQFSNPTANFILPINLPQQPPIKSSDSISMVCTVCVCVILATGPWGMFKLLGGGFPTLDIDPSGT